VDNAEINQTNFCQGQFWVRRGTSPTPHTSEWQEGINKDSARVGSKRSNWSRTQDHLQLIKQNADSVEIFRLSSLTPRSTHKQQDSQQTLLCQNGKFSSGASS
jgi:hypothetical protein